MLSTFINEFAEEGEFANYFKDRDFGEEYFWPTFFPKKTVGSLHYETLVGSRGSAVAAAVTAHDSSAPLARRKVLKKLSGEIPSIKLKIEMSTTDFNDYIALKNRNDVDREEILEIVANDPDFVYKAVDARREWLAMQALSSGVITLDSDTNEHGIQTETSIDFQLQDGNKEYIGSAGGTAAATHYWTTACITTNDPIADIRAVVAEMRDEGVRCKYMVMNRDKYAAFIQSDAVKDFATGLIVNTNANSPIIGTLNSLNARLKDVGFPEIIISDSIVDLYDENYACTATECWVERYVSFLPELAVGRFLHAPVAEFEQKKLLPHVVMAKKNGIIVSQWGSTDPIRTWTKGETNAMPSFPAIDRCWILNTESHTAF